ncbi:DUF998 domain-containing protein [Rhodococcus sp. 14C212]|uniref:DUF998 domain-containing protein n=1 Tax=Rhodococcus sp. 14C212 TaxID=2711209 RepID=UPI0013ED2051|nr:DUF998 domain-containing protein [Rhodococcus sp. 14C212]NGP09388.1 DUF998 domain-containing protein [Rhodococcus sp. 14C212]
MSTHVGAGPGTRLVPGRAAAIAGIVAPLLFTVVVLAQQAARRGEYSPTAETISALEAGPNGWIQQINFVVLGMLLLLFAVAVYRGPAGVLGPVLIGLAGVGALIAAVFPLREDAAGVTYDPGYHFVSGFTFFSCIALGLVVTSRRLARDGRFPALSRYVLGAGLVAAAGVPLMVVLVLPDDAPLHDVAGLVQRGILWLVVFPALVALGVRLRAGNAPARQTGAR